MASSSQNFTIAECNPLLPKPATSQQKWKRRCFPKLRYRLPIISEKGAIIMIVWNFFFMMSLFSSASQIIQSKDYYIQLIEFAVILSLSILIDVAADCWIGRYRILQMGMYILLLAVIFTAIDTLIIHQSILVLSYTATACLALALACYSACVIQFTTDQIIGASGEQLSFTVYWIVWGYISAAFIGIYIRNLYLFTPTTKNIVLFGTSSVSLIVAICLIECGNQLLITKPLLYNPIKQIAKVLNYARKHKYPERRSALTYWEDDCPSRIDLGKDKYGGPFTVEEVEDVKTILGLIPVIASAVSLIIPLGSKWLWLTSNHNYNLLHNEFHSFFTTAGLIFLFSLPIYHTIIYPLFYNYIPSMLRRIVIGYFLTLLFLLSQCCVEIVENSDSMNMTCSSVNTTGPDSASSWWEVGPNVILAFSILIILYALFEFLISQSPHRVKGVVLCIMYACAGFLGLTSLGLSRLLQKLKIQLFPGCGFYRYFIYSIIAAVLLIMLLIVSRWYKPRKRNDVVPYRMSAEEHFESS